MRRSQVGKRVSIALESVALGESVATEGFLDLLKKWFSNKEEKKTESEISVYKWVTENTTNGKLKDDLTLKGSEIKAKLPTNLLLRKQISDSMSSEELARELAGDLPKYDPKEIGGFTDFIAAADVKESLEKEVENLGNDWEQFRKVVLSYKDKLPKPHKLDDDQRLDRLGKKRDVTIVTDSIDDVNKLLTVAAEFWTLSWKMGDTSSWHIGIDGTDYPYRRFVDEIDEDTEVSAILNPLFEPTFEDRYPNPSESMSTRLREIYEELIVVIRHSVK